MSAQSADRGAAARWPNVADMMQHELVAMSAPSGLDARWRALAARDAAADGSFVYGVTSTGVYCRPSCPSRRPRADRVRFFDTGAQARQQGFRPCKRCKPDQVGLGIPGMEAVRRVSAFLAAHAADKPRGPRVPSADGVPIAYEIHGQGSPALVLVHGWSCDRGYWKDQVEYLGAQYQLVLVDLAGHGESGTARKDYTMAAFGADVAAVVDSLKLDKVVLVGHSMGSDVVVEHGSLLGPVPDRALGELRLDGPIAVSARPPRLGEQSRAEDEGIP